MPEISIKAEKLFELWHIPVTNSMVLSLVTLLLLLGFAWFMRSRMSLVPGKIQSIFELLREQILAFMENVLGNRHAAEKYFPLVATCFMFIIISNWLGLLPIVGPIGLRHMTEEGSGLIPLFRAPAADLNFTIALALISVFSINFISVMALGMKKFIGRFIHLRSPILTGVGIIEIFSEFVRIISFSFRLFGNVFAGEVILIVVAFLAPLLLPIPFLFLEIFVGFIQAFIFSMLTLVFISMGVSETEH